MLPKGSLFKYFCYFTPSTNLNRFCVPSLGSLARLFIDPMVILMRTLGSIVVHVICVDDILMILSDEARVSATKAYLYQQFFSRDMGTPQNFFGFSQHVSQVSLLYLRKNMPLNFPKKSNDLDANKSHQ